MILQNLFNYNNEFSESYAFLLLEKKSEYSTLGKQKTDCFRNLLFILYLHYNGNYHRFALRLLIDIFCNFIFYFKLHLTPIITAIEADVNGVTRNGLDAVYKRFGLFRIDKAA